jgi:hypothetical protein
MSKNPQDSSRRAWHRGPWSTDIDAATDNVDIHSPEVDGDFATIWASRADVEATHATARLMALAPDMADALLELDDHGFAHVFDSTTAPVELLHTLTRLAAKLRAINADTTEPTP